MADISAYIRQIQIAARGEEVRDSIVDALNGMNDSIPVSIEDAMQQAKESGEFDGDDGNGISGITLNNDYTLTITFDDGTSYTTSSIRGPQGPIGNPGVSPSVTLSSITGGTRITVTDSVHPTGQSFDVLNGPEGERGPTGNDGTSPSVSISTITGGSRVTVIDADHPEGQSFDVLDGSDGVSPSVSIEAVTGGHRVTVTDADHPSGQSFDVTDGTDGADGYDGISPTVTIATITGGHRVTITDADHPEGQNFDVMDGSGGGGSGSGDMLASLYDPDNDVAAAGGIKDYVSAHALDDIDEAPTENSVNPVKSRGIYAALSDCQTKLWVASISLPANAWSNTEPYYQAVNIAGITANSMIDIQPGASVIDSLQDDGVTAIWAENDNGSVKVYTLGAAPTSALTLQCTITEVGNTAFPSYDYLKWIESVELNSDYTLTLNFTNGESYTTASIRGEKGDTGDTGARGQTGETGSDGVSPAVTITDITGGSRVIITDAEHPSGQSFDVLDGTDGSDGNDGTSPAVTVTNISGGHRVTITDADHPTGQSFDVIDGAGSGDMQASIYDADSSVLNAGGIKAFVGTKVTSISSSSTNTQYPTAKAVYDLFDSIENLNEVSF